MKSNVEKTIDLQTLRNQGQKIPTQRVELGLINEVDNKIDREIEARKWRQVGQNSDGVILARGNDRKFVSKGHLDFCYKFIDEV